MSAPVAVGPDLLRARPLPRHDQGDDKEDRGRVLVVGGDAGLAGGAMLAGVSALRAGAGKLQIATAASAAGWVAVAVPECRALPLPEGPDGAIAASAGKVIRSHLDHTAALVVGPGMMDEAAASALVADLLSDPGCPALLLDAAALCGLTGQEPALARRRAGTVITPHAGEMAACLGLDKAEVEADPLAVARRAARALNSVVALKGGRTRIVAPDGEAYESDHGQVGLATSGSGDTLSGIVGGLLARGADPLTAALWGVWVHAEAGERLARRRGPLGFLARELPDEVPAILAELCA
jgi:hydroxyethylthiazole kinase-like uncharacterized protein yjeF